MSEPRAVSKTRLIKWFRSCVDQATKSGDWTDYDPDCEKAIRRLIENGPEVSMGWVEQWLDANVPCNCHEAYTSRKMRDPNCFRHGSVGDVDWEKMLREAGVRVKKAVDE